ncbi:type II secretion system F family protein [Vibrio sp. ED004]|uniref:type II secretion system F family protein n=1 Tax=Vibrio sp. ED004 TaxID=2785124 RepID=UPI00205BD14B|nr:type II secretion system F family protein [Vibrio sp. ED004]UPR58181.1 type II secretion system F family protein [Vibrio sp. ED004]
MLYWLSMLIGGLVLLLIYWPSKKQNQHNYLTLMDSLNLTNELADERQALNINNSSNKISRKLFENLLTRVIDQLGKNAKLKIYIYISFFVLTSYMINEVFFKAEPILFVPTMLSISLLLGYFWLQKRERKQFDDDFPDALGLLASAVSAGESINSAIVYVGDSFDNNVGKEFKLMGERLKTGESLESILDKSLKRFPYPSFYFFVISLKVNASKGGQLKVVISNLNRLMFNSRAIEKKTAAHTSEARMSAKIVASLPFFFIFLLKFVSPENYDFIVNDPDGEFLLYYVVCSELLGLFLIWILMKSVSE